MGARGARGRCSTGASAGGASFGLLREPGGLPGLASQGVSRPRPPWAPRPRALQRAPQETRSLPRGFPHYPLGLSRLAFSEKPFNQNRFPDLMVDRVDLLRLPYNR